MNKKDIQIPEDIESSKTVEENKMSEKEIPTPEDIESSKTVKGYDFGKIKSPHVVKNVIFEDEEEVAPGDIQKTMDRLRNTVTAEDPHFVIDGNEQSNDAPMQEIKAPQGAQEEVSDEMSEEKENRIENRPLESYVVKRVMGAIKLEPLVVFVEVEGEEEGEVVGVPGFYDSTNDRFVLLDGSPVPSKEFDIKFKEYVELKKTEKKD